MLSDTKKPQVHIVGAGIGGIATAALLARQGFNVTVVEKCAQPGGRCGRMTIEGFTFDTGATLFLMRDLYERLFTSLGERLEDHLNLQRIDPTYHLYFQDNSQLQLTSDLPTMQRQMEAFEPGSFRHMLRYLDEGGYHYNQSLPKLVERDFHNLAEFINPANLLLFLRLKALTRHDRYVARFFKDPRLQMAFTFHDMYMGLSPYESPALYSLMQYTELADGLWYPHGGMYSITEALVEIAKKLGVQFMLNAPVQSILVNGNRTSGLTMQDGRVLLSDIVIANADLGYTYDRLLPPNGHPGVINKKEYGCSTVSFFWGLDKQYPQLGAHNLFFCGDYRQGFETIFKDLYIAEEPNFYIHAPVRLDPSMAPEGQDTLIVAVPVGRINEKSPQDWGSIKTRLRAFILRRLHQIGITDLEEHIKVEVSVTPEDWQRRYNLPFGSTHGLSHKLTQMAYFRPHIKHPRYANLYFVGASTHPGTGIPTVMVSSRHVAARVQQDWGGNGVKANE
jgi:phytoene desaturase